MPNYERAIARLKITLERQHAAIKTTEDTIAALEAALAAQTADAKQKVKL